MNPLRDPIHLLGERLADLKLSIARLSELLPALDATASGDQAVQLFDRMQRCGWLAESAVDLAQGVTEQKVK